MHSSWSMATRVALVLVLAAGLRGQSVFLTEDFSGATGTTPPAGWSSTALALPAFPIGSAAFWRFDNPAGRPFAFPFTAPFAIVDAQWNGVSTHTRSFLRSPAFDVSQAQNLSLEFDHQYRDFGSTITVEFFDGRTWNAVFSANGFDIGYLQPDPDSVVSQFIDLQPFAGGSTRSRIRFIYEGYNDWWWAVDNVQVYEPAALDIAMVSIDQPRVDPHSCLPFGTAETISITARNNSFASLAPGTFLQFEYTIDGGPPVTEFHVLTTTLSPQQKFNFSFATGADLSQPGQHVVATKVIAAGDPFPGNDTRQRTYQSPPAATIAVGYVENFDSLSLFTNEVPAGWLNDRADFASTNLGYDDDWFVSNSGPIFGGGGVQVDHTSGTGNFLHVQDFADTFDIRLESPCIDTSSGSHPAATFWVFSDIDPGDPLDNLLDIDVIDVNSGFITPAVTTIPGNGRFSDWTLHVVDLTAYAPSPVRVVFRGRTDNNDFRDPVAIDDFAIQDLLLDNGQAPRPGLASLDVNRATNALGLRMLSGLPGPYFARVRQGTPLELDWTGVPNQPIAWLHGPLNRVAASYPGGIGQFDIGGPGVDPQGIPVGIGVIADGIAWSQNQAGLPLDAFFFVGPGGTGGLSLLVPAFGNPPGTVLTTFQLAILDVQAPFVRLSNAVELTLD